MPDTQHLELRGRTWWYIRFVRADLRPKLPMPHTGKAQFRVNLKTDSLIHAQKVRPQLNAEFDRLLTVAKKRKLGFTEELLIEDARDLRLGVIVGDGGDGAEEAIRSTVEELALERAERLQKEFGEDLAAKFYQTATGTKQGTDIDEHLEMFIAKHPAKPHTDYKRRAAVRMLNDWRANLYVESVTLPLARKFVDDVLSRDRTAATINSYLTPLVSFWQWMIDQELVKGVANPWPKLRPKKERKAPEEQERAFTPDELGRLFKGKQRMRPDVHDCAVMSALTGARLDEIGSLKVKHIDLTNVTIFLPGSKTEAAPRLIPLHEDLIPLVTRRTAGKQPDDWLFHELPDRKKDALKARSSPITQAFTRFRRQAGVGGKTAQASPVTFHSFRRWSATKMEEADVPSHIVDAIHGWKRGDMRSRYTASADLMRQMREAVGKLKLPLNYAVDS